MTQYIFGTSNKDGVFSETLKTVSESHTDLFGFVETIREYSDRTISDRFRIVRKLRSSEDSSGKCYDWYSIDSHYRETDRTLPIKERQEQDRADIDYIAMEAGIEL